VLQEVSFESGGVRCAADLYRPAKAGKGLACVVMGHGGSATKRLGLHAYAAKFTAAGLAVLAFDYRHFGASGGEPRQVVDVAEQRDDYRAAVRYVRRRDDIDPHRVALWGTSLSGGHVLAVAATDPVIAAVVLQVPLIDGWHRGRRLRERLSWEVTWQTLQFIVAALRDVIGAKSGPPPYLVSPIPARLRYSLSPRRNPRSRRWAAKPSAGALRWLRACCSPCRATAKEPRRSCACRS
jgi:fermentation-respiration switch protein FrsA (DUF1100 family)